MAYPHPWQRARELVVKTHGEGVELVPVDRLPQRPYEFDPAGWLLFYVQPERVTGVGGWSHYVAIHPYTGEVRLFAIATE